MKTTYLITWRSGLVEFVTTPVPSGAILIATVNDQTSFDVLERTVRENTVLHDFQASAFQLVIESFLNADKNDDLVELLGEWADALAGHMLGDDHDIDWN